MKTNYFYNARRTGGTSFKPSDESGGKITCPLKGGLYGHIMEGVAKWKSAGLEPGCGTCSGQTPLHPVLPGRCFVFLSHHG